MRASGYGINGTPTAVFDGTAKSVGGMASGSMYGSYEPMVLSELNRISPLNIAASYVLLDGQVTVTTDITVDQTTSGSNRQVLFFVTQEDLHGHLNMVVAMLPNEAFSLTTPGQSVSIERSFPLNAAWTEPNLNIIVVVQNTATKEVYQAGQAIPDYAGTVVLDCDPNGVDAAWTLTGPGLTLGGHGDDSIDVFAPGQYSVAWEDVAYWDAPASPQLQTLVQGSTVTFAGTYSNGPFTPVTAGPLGDIGAGAAVALVDLDNDGDLDVHMTSSGGTDRLLRNEGGHVYTDLAASPLVAASSVRGAAWADINGDGNADVYVARINQANQLFLGDGAGGFTQAITFGDNGTGPSSSAAWVDYDNDGVLDVSVANEGTANLLLDNQGEIAPGMVLFNTVNGAIANAGNAACVVWGDGNLDGRPDPFIVNQFSANVLLESTTFGFSDLTNGQGMGDLGNGKGAAWGDYDNDGDLDLYVANDGQADRLYKCTGPFQYTQVGGPNLGDNGRGRGVTWADFDNDGKLDLYLARRDQPDLLLLGDGAGGFERVPVGPDEATLGSNAVACGDVNGDGRIDVLVSREGAANVIFENSLATTNHWVRLDLTGAGSNTGAIGARVRLTAGGITQTRYISPGSGYLCSNDPSPHFGLGAATVVEGLEIFWPDGTHQIVGSLPVDRTTAIIQGEDPAAAVGDEELPRVTTLGVAYPNPFNPSTTISFTLDRATRAQVSVYTVDGRHVRTLTDESYAAGAHQVVWQGTDGDGRAVASGAYLYRLSTSEGFAATGTMVLVK